VGIRLGRWLKSINSPFQVLEVSEYRGPKMLQGLQKRRGFRPPVGGEMKRDLQKMVRENFPCVNLNPRYEVEKGIQFDPEREVTVHFRLNRNCATADERVNHDRVTVFISITIQYSLHKLSGKPLHIGRPAVHRFVRIGLKLDRLRGVDNRNA
jgi:hypothetical protein